VDVKKLKEGLTVLYFHLRVIMSGKQLYGGRVEMAFESRQKGSHLLSFNIPKNVCPSIVLLVL
jgi:hypothetical protein